MAERMMKNADFLVIGGGITGAAIAYELQKQGHQVLLLEQAPQPRNATYYSYGGVPYWAGQQPWQKQLCQEGRDLCNQLATELEGVTEYRELDLLLTLSPQDEPEPLAQNFQSCWIPPDYLTVDEAVAVEPLLNPEAITGAFRVSHGHLHAEKTVHSYLQAFLRLGGKIVLEKVTNLLVAGETIQGVRTTHQDYFASQVILCAGGLSRALLQSYGVNLPLYFSQAFLLKTPPLHLTLKSLIMPAKFQRLTLEAQAHSLDWERVNNTVQREVLEPGAIQFLDRHCYLGQISQVVTNPDYQPSSTLLKQQLHQAIAHLLPAFAEIPTELCHCLVAFSGSPQPLMGPVANWAGLQLFTGFSSTILYAPILARHFAQWLTTERDPLLQSWFQAS